MNDHTLIEELTAVRVLGGLEDADYRVLTEQLDSHGPGCAECASIQASFSEVAGRLAFALDPIPLSDAGQARVLGAILGSGEVPQAGSDQEGDPQPSGVVDIASARREQGDDSDDERARPRTWVRIVAAGVAAAVLFAGGIGLGYLATPRTPSSQQAQEQALVKFLPGASVTPFSATNGGQLAYASKAGSADVFVWGSGLRQPPPNHVYQLWTINGKTPSPGPTFVPTNGKAVVRMQTDLAGSQVMAVTVEPVGGSKQPTTTPVFTAPIGA